MYKFRYYTHLSIINDYGRVSNKKQATSVIKRTTASVQRDIELFVHANLRFLLVFITLRFF